MSHNDYLSKLNKYIREKALITDRLAALEQQITESMRDYAEKAMEYRNSVLSGLDPASLVSPKRFASVTASETPFSSDQGTSGNNSSGCLSEMARAQRKRPYQDNAAYARAVNHPIYGRKADDATDAKKPCNTEKK
ncbi:hypothetical protein DICVIV_11036 [Dictyocaulus viviparus]|uniref:Uncharacterized protein n=1 Tax=Dictyocaulus viviparus TaxID=29172 RepID=A0A0D8XED4_DICVI|nr:hypothetical protein DICVIV_11036 [Dictyocaulus viviparus]